MEKAIEAKFQARADILKALAHSTRLFIVDELSRGERCVCELTDMIGVDTSTVSKHLSLLKSAGIVKADKRGLQVYYSLKMSCVMSFFGCMESVLHTQAQQRLKLVQIES